MKRVLWALSVVILAACVSPVVRSGAAAPDGPNGSPAVAGLQVTEADVTQKLVLANRLLSDSPVVRRVEASRDRGANAQLTAARRLFKRATAAYDAGDLRRANDLLDDTLRSISEAGRIVPEREERLARERYAQLLGSIETFRAWNERVSREKIGARQVQAPLSVDTERTRDLVHRAAALEKAGDVAGANRLLAEAQASVTGALNQLVANETLVYRQEFATPRDAYRYECDRYASYEALLPIAVGTLLPSSDAGALADRSFGEAEILRRSAAAASETGHHDDALERMRAAVAKLQQAFEGLGVVVPQQIPEGT